MTKPILRFHNISNDVTAFSTTRHGGYSIGNYSEFNINNYCGDSPESTEKNLTLLCNELGITKDHLVMPHQTHGTEIRQIASDFFSLSPSTRKLLLEGVDAVMTDLEEVCIGVSTADCIPVLLYDPEHRVCCAVHAGWRGTVEHIVMKAVKALTHVYSTRPENLTACIGPGISLESFEVGDEVYEQFAQSGFDTSRVCRRYEKWHIDLWECNRIDLLTTGVNPESINVCGICTYKNVDEFFSARRLGTESGRIFTGIKINKRL